MKDTGGSPMGLPIIILVFAVGIGVGSVFSTQWASSCPPCSSEGSPPSIITAEEPKASPRFAPKMAAIFANLSERDSYSDKGMWLLEQKHAEDARHYLLQAAAEVTLVQSPAGSQFRAYGACCEYGVQGVRARIMHYPVSKAPESARSWVQLYDAEAALGHPAEALRSIGTPRLHAHMSLCHAWYLQAIRAHRALLSPPGTCGGLPN